MGQQASSAAADAVTAGSNILDFDPEPREIALRKVIQARLVASPAPQLPDAIVATYFLALRTQTLTRAGAEISYHATNGTKYAEPGSLVDRCAGRVLGVDAFDGTERVGLIHVAYPLLMLVDSNGHLTSTDILHTAAGAVVFDIYEYFDSKLVALEIPPSVVAGFPGPAYGPEGVRARTGFKAGTPMFGTILKPTAGLTPGDVGALVREVAGQPALGFVKEDENLYPGLPYSPVGQRAAAAVAAIAAVSGRRGGRGLLFAPHMTSAPHQLPAHLEAALAAGANAVMLSESFAGGAVRMVREATRTMTDPPAIYGHNAGIGVRTTRIWREVIDMLARLDGIDFRQTGPVRPGPAFLRPYGDEWVASEAVLNRPIDGIRPTMITRAGALDQGNIGLNLADAEHRGLQDNILFLAGSALNSIKNRQGQVDQAVGIEAMLQAVQVHRDGDLAGVAPEEHLPRLFQLARSRPLPELENALRQRYPELSTAL